MAKKKKDKLNVKRLAIVAAVGAVILGGLGGGYLYVKQRTGYERDVEAAKAAVQQNDWREAQRRYGRALQKKQNDPSLWTMYADATAQLVRDDEENYRNAYSAYRQALQIDPKYLPAARRVMQLFRDEVKAGAGGQSAQDADQSAAAVLAIAPNDPEASAVQAYAKLRRTIQPGVRPDPEELDAAIARLDDLNAAAGKDADPDSVSLVLQAKLFRAAQVRANQPDRAAQQVAEAFKSADDRVAASPDRARPLVSAASVRLMAGTSDQLEPDKSKRAALVDAAMQLLDKAVPLAKDDPALLQSIYLTRASVEQQRGKVPAAIEALRAAIDAEPYEPGPRQELADLLTRTGKAEDALKLLEQPTPPSPATATPLEIIRRRSLEPQRLLALARIRVDTLPPAQPATPATQAARDQALKQVEADLAAALAHPAARRLQLADSPGVLRVQASVLLARNEVAKADELIARATSRLPSDDGDARSRFLRVQLMLMRVQTASRLNQTGVARKTLETLVAQLGDSNDQFPQGREALVQLMIQEGDLEAAGPLIDKLLQLDPNNPTYQRFDLARKSRDPQARSAAYAKMPEATPDDLKAKLQVAGALGNLDEVVRLSRAVLAADKANRQATMLGAQALLRQGKKQEATSSRPPSPPTPSSPTPPTSRSSCSPARPRSSGSSSATRSPRSPTRTPATCRCTTCCWPSRSRRGPPAT
jgi:hypothetical protein